MRVYAAAAAASTAAAGVASACAAPVTTGASCAAPAAAPAAATEAVVALRVRLATGPGGRACWREVPVYQPLPLNSRLRVLTQLGVRIDRVKHAGIPH